MAPHRSEADAVRAMRDLYAWGEIVVKAMESGMIYEDDDESEGRSTVTGLDVDGDIRIAQAAKRFCHWLGDRDAWEECEKLLGRLREREERE